MTIVQDQPTAAATDVCPAWCDRDHHEGAYGHFRNVGSIGVRIEQALPDDKAPVIFHPLFGPSRRRDDDAIPLDLARQLGADLIEAVHIVEDAEMGAPMSITAHQMGVSVVHRGPHDAVIEVDGTLCEGGPLLPKGARIMARALLEAAEECDGWE